MGASDATMTFTGTVDEINAALNGMTFLPSLNYNGTAATVGITTDDLGNTGTGGATDRYGRSGDNGHRGARPASGRPLLGQRHSGDSRRCYRVELHRP